MKVGKKNEATPYVDSDPAKDWTATWTKFVNVELSKDDKEQWAVWTMENNLYEVLARQTKNGRQFTTKIDAKQGCGLATCLERDRKSPNAGKMVSARGMDAGTALSRVLFIVEVVFGNDPWEGLVVLRDDDRW